MASYIALFFSLVSLIIMVVILIKFKNLFSTDSIIEKTKAHINRVIMDVNNNTSRDIQLIDEASRKLKIQLNEAEKKMENFREATQLLRDAIAEAEKAGTGGAAAFAVDLQENKSIKKSRINYSENNKLSEIRPVGQKHKKNPYIDPDAAYRVNTTEKNGQRSLFDDAEENSVLKDETILTTDGAAYKEVPLVNTRMYDDKTAVNNQKSFGEQEAVSAVSEKNLSERVEKLFRQGMQIEDIAVELSCSTSEVQFIIDML